STYQWINAFPPPLDRHIGEIVSGVARALGQAQPATRTTAPAAPKYIGPFTIVTRLGEGGMGTVYKAEQTSPVRRTVAIKLIKLGMDSKEVLARFESERQALARMDHPHIARVLE